MKHVDFSQSVSAVGETQTLRQNARLGGKFSLYRTIGKRALDISIAVLVLPVVLPLIGLLVCLVRLDGGSGLFAHMRVGRDGTMFRCWKIRTMVLNSEEALLNHLRTVPDAAAEWERDHKLTNDPRVTRLGQILRKTSLDELPQLWNVLKGDMSIVGPRPIVVAEMPKYGAHQSAYLAMKPGITGIWQVSGRNDVTYDERVGMDVTYFETMSLSRDVTLIAKTALAVINKTGK